MESEVEKETVPKPSPIYIPFVENISVMIKKISSVISQSDFNYKSLKQGEIRLITKNADSYRKVVKYFESSKICYHTFQLKQDRSFRVVIKGLHYSTPPEDIKGVLLSLDHHVRTVTNVKSRVTKEPLSLFYVELDPKSNNKEIYNLKTIHNCLVKIEPPIRSFDLVQCHRCQLYGHTKAYCKRPFRCVKCGLDHPTSECTKQLSSPPRCLHCLGNHTANYKGCKIYQDLITKRSNRQGIYSNERRNPNFSINNKDYPQLNGVSNNEPNNNRYNMSYSEALKTSNLDYNTRLEKLESMMESLMNMVTMLMSKICK